MDQTNPKGNIEESLLAGHSLLGSKEDSHKESKSPPPLEPDDDYYETQALVYPAEIADLDAVIPEN